MNVQPINNFNSPNFGARIKINKAVSTEFLSGSIASGVGSTVSAAGALSVSPALDPAHHIFSVAKIYDGIQAALGTCLATGGALAMRLSTSFFKAGVKDASKINPKKIPS